MSTRGNTTVMVPQPARDLVGIRRIFDPALVVDPDSDLYEPRDEPALNRLVLDLADKEGALHAFLCGHRGSGKSTELQRLRSHVAVTSRYESLYLTAADFGNDAVDLTHDSLLVEIGLALASRCEALGTASSSATRLAQWGQEVVQSFSSTQAAEMEAGLGGNAWLAFFKAQLRSRREWNVDQIQRLEPKVKDLIAIVNDLALDLESIVQKRPLVIVDDLEKGDSEAHRDMHRRVFRDYFDTLVQPRFSIIYTLPVYFRSLPDSRVPQDQTYAFPAARLYDRADKGQAETRQRPGGLSAHAGIRLATDCCE